MRVKTGIIYGGSSKHREKSFQNATFLFLHLPTYAIEKVLIWINKEGKYFLVEDSCFVKGSLQENIIQEIEPSTLGQYINIAIDKTKIFNNRRHKVFVFLVVSRSVWSFPKVFDWIKI